MVTGDSGVGKSTLAMDIAGRVANGGTFLGKPVIEVPVLYIDRENSLATVRERLDRLHVAETSRLKF
jgi:predicted ATP-dependent serine protease